MVISIRKYYWIFVIAVWVLLALFMSNQLYEAYLQSDKPITWLTALIMEMAYVTMWILLAPVVWRLSLRFKFDRRSWFFSGVIHIIAGMLLSSLTMALRTVLQWAIINNFQTSLSWQNVMNAAFTYYDYGIMSYLLLLLISYAFIYYERFRERDIAAAVLETQLTQAQLQSLKMQLHPHFLFNTLHAIAVLIRKNENQNAIRMLTGLSDLLRYSLNNTHAQEVALKQELEMLDLYLKIQQTRFQDRLSVSIEVQPDALEAQIPNFLLQPLVENAIQHGVAPLAQEGNIQIQAVRENGMLSISIRDNGAGVISSQKELQTQGIGLSNTIARLDKLYGASYRFCLGNHPEGGAIVSVSIPYRTSEKL